MALLISSQNCSMTFWNKLESKFFWSYTVHGLLFRGIINKVMKNRKISLKNRPVGMPLVSDFDNEDMMSTRLQTSAQVAPAEDLGSLIEGCKRQDRESQRLLYLQYYGFALKIVYRYVADYSASVRLTNETMIKIFRSFSGFKALKHMTLESSFGRWMK